MDFTKLSLEELMDVEVTSVSKRRQRVADGAAAIEDELRFTIGSKVEHNDSTGAEVQPSARILWTPTPTQSVNVAAMGHRMNPLHQASLRSLIDLGHGWEFDLWPRYIDNLTDHSIESYVSLDARLGWRPTNAIEFSLVGQNLLDSRRKETVPELLPLTATQVERAAYGKLTLRF